MIAVVVGRSSCCCCCEHGIWVVRRRRRRHFDSLFFFVFCSEEKGEESGRGVRGRGKKEKKKGAHSDPPAASSSVSLERDDIFRFWPSGFLFPSRPRVWGNSPLIRLCIKKTPFKIDRGFGDGKETAGKSSVGLKRWGSRGVYGGDESRWHRQAKLKVDSSMSTSLPRAFAVLPAFPGAFNVEFDLIDWVQTSKRRETSR